MATYYDYKRERSDDLISLKCRYSNIDGDKIGIKLALDTGATHTVFDLNELFLAGYRIKDSVGVIEAHTGKGVVKTYQFVLPTFEALGLVRENFTVMAYDFLLESGFVDICSGMVGLDFFEQTNLNVNFSEQWITLQAA